MRDKAYRLEGIVDFVLDTRIPVGDGLLNYQGIQYGIASTLIDSTNLMHYFNK